MYSIIDRKSFDRIKNIYSKIIRPNSIAIILIANKKDLEEKRVVKKEEGESLAKEWKCAFMETSGKSGENIEKAFETLVMDWRTKSEDLKKTVRKGSVGGKNGKNCNIQ